MGEDDFDFDDLETQNTKNNIKSARGFADQRRKLKPNRKHAASRNPVKVLQTREDVKEDLFVSDDDEDDLDGLDEIINGSIGKQVNGIKENREIRVVGRKGGLNTGKIKTREVELAKDAKKGLESKEDIHSASKGLRVTEKDRKTGVGTEKTNPYDGVKDVMFFHIKGARHVQMRLIEPKTCQMNSGDVFVLVTPKYVHQWNGKNCSIMEKARGSEVSAVVQQWKELGCTATFVNVMDENREKPGIMTKTFWKILGDKKEIQKIEDIISDKDFEKGILESNRFYEIKCNDEDDEDAECSLELIDEYSGKVPSKKWLDSHKAYVLDFGTEVYSWIGRHTKGAPRKKAVEIGLEHFNKGYECDTSVHPFDTNTKNENKSKHMTRPAWSVYGRMAEKTENVAFRRKFYDWPDPVDLKVKTVEAKVHAQLTKEYTEPSASSSLLPISGRDLTQPTVEPLMVMDGSFIGRGRGMRDDETLFKYGVTLNELTIWQVSASSFEELPPERYGIFYSAESYIIKWNFEIFRTGIRNLKGGTSKHEDTGKDRIFFFFWQGIDCSSSDKGTAALMTVEMDTEEGPQIQVQQGKEPPAFFQLFDGKMVVHSGKVTDDPKFMRNRLYWIRNEVDAEVCLVEVPLSSGSLRSRGCFIVVNGKQDVLFLWKGDKASKVTIQRAEDGVKNYKEKVSKLHSKSFEIIDIREGDESNEFWDTLGDEEDYMSYLEVTKSFDFTPRCFTFDSLHGYFRFSEITSTAYSPDHICPFPILQNDLYELSQPGLVFIDLKHKMFLWQGWWPASDDENIDAKGPNTRAEKHRFDVNRKLAMESIKNYADVTGRNSSRIYIVFGGCEPLEFKNIFPYWKESEEITKMQQEAGHIQGQKQNLLTVLEQLSKDEYTLAELKQTPLPEGVDPTRIEYYLNQDDFKTLFGVTKEEFPKVPRWKQIELKKKTGLF